jgi:cytosine/uracil/thiamine/allantoin permease
LLGGIFTLYAVVIVVSLFFIRTMDDAVRLLSEVAKVLGPIAGVIVAFYYERERRIG